MAIRRMGLVDGVKRVALKPTGIVGRHRPWYFMNLVDRLRGSGTLEEAVGGKIVLITGASSGIGAELARRVGAAGGTVLLVARGKDALAEVREAVTDAGGRAFVHACDLSDLDAIGGLASEVLAQHDRVDVLVNNAGRSIRRSIELSYERIHDFERTIQLNYLAAVRMVLSFLPGMREGKDGHIVNVSSAGVQAKAPRFSGYVASKAALDAFSECVAAEVRSDGVQFTTVYMPLVRTPMIEPTTIYRRFPAMTPGEAADMVGAALIHRPRRLGTPVGNVASFVNSVSPTSMDAIRDAAFHLFPESSAARVVEEVAGDEDQRLDELSPLAAAFARMGRGIHW